MSTTTHTDRPALQAPPRVQARLITRLRQSLFQSPASAVLTILTIWLVLMLAPPLAQWLLVKASFQAPDAQACREAGGACWAFIREKYRLILFGAYPHAEQWRPLLATALLVASIVWTATRRLAGLQIVGLWVFTILAVATLMWGGFLGLVFVENTRWGGLPLTLILSTFGIACAFPIGILLALGRRSRMPAIKAMCVAYIELIRGVPLISLLFLSSVMLPCSCQRASASTSC